MPYRNCELNWNKYIIFEKIIKFGEGAIKPVSKQRRFILNVNTDPHAHRALWTYACSVIKDNPQLSNDIFNFIKNESNFKAPNLEDWED
jgi:hypothetical protein